jgi:hypothetical protein
MNDAPEEALRSERTPSGDRAFLPEYRERELVFARIKSDV